MSITPRGLFITHWDIKNGGYDNELKYLNESQYINYTICGWRKNILTSKAERIRCYLLQSFYCIKKWNQFDIIITNQQYIGLFICLFNYLAFSRPKKIINTGLLVNFRKNYFNKIIAKIIYKGSDKIIVFSKAYSEQLKLFFKDNNKIEFRHLPNTPLEYNNEVETKDIFCGGFSNRDFSTIINAFKNTEYSVTIIAPKLAQIYSNIYIINKANEREFYKIMNQHKITAVILEDPELPNGQLLITKAMSAGKIVIATDCLASRDYIEDMSNGMLVPPKNAQALLDTVNKVFTNSGLSDNIKKNAQLFFQDNISWSGFWSSLEKSLLGLNYEGSV